jgi:serine phosphatase RsbU (regulator of sigma subunit)
MAASRAARGPAGEVERLTAEVERLAAEVQRLTGEVGDLEAARDVLRGRLEHELAVARRIQLSLMPRTLPQPHGWRIATAYRAAREVGGDFFDAYELPRRPGRIGFVVADVTGKGVTAALMMAFTRAVLRSAAYNGDGPADALERTNRVLVNDARTGLFVTVFIGELDPASGRVRYASAGHEPPLVVLEGARSVAALELPDTVLLGAFADFRASEASIVLGRGDLLVAYTDGVTDARDASGARFGEARLREVLAGTFPSKADAAVSDVVSAIDAFTGDEPAADDVTLLVLGREA